MPLELQLLRGTPETTSNISCALIMQPSAFPHNLVGLHSATTVIHHSPSEKMLNPAWERRRKQQWALNKAQIDCSTYFLLSRHASVLSFRMLLGKSTRGLMGMEEGWGGQGTPLTFLEQTCNNHYSNFLQHCTSCATITSRAGRSAFHGWRDYTYVEMVNIIMVIQASRRTSFGRLLHLQVVTRSSLGS